MWKFTLFLFFCLGTVGIVLAQQPNPTVQIVLDQPTAQMGQTITAEVYVRGAVNIIGTDIGITVDPTCLRVTDRLTGEFLPTQAAQGGSSPFEELHDHDTRLAAAILKGGPIANGDGVFFRAKLEVVCAAGVAPINVSFAELTGMEAPVGQPKKFVDYKLDKGNVTTINAQLAIGPAGSVTAVPAQTLEANATAMPTSTPAVVPVAPIIQNTSQDQTLLAVALGIMALAVIGFIILVVVERRRRKR